MPDEIIYVTIFSMIRKQLKFTFFQSILLLMLVQMSTDIYLPSQLAISMDLNVSIAFVKLTITATIIGLGLSQLYYGPLSDCIGRRKVVLYGLFIFSIGSILLVLTNNAYIFMIARIMQGIGLGFGLSIASAVASDIYRGKKLYQSLSLISIIYAVMPVLAPVIGGTLQTLLNWRASFWLLFISGIFMFGFAFSHFVETKSNLTQKRPPVIEIISLYKQFLKSKLFVANFAILTLFYTGEVGYIIQMPLIAQKIFVVTPFLTGWLVLFTSLAIIIGSSLSMYLLKKFKPITLVNLGVLCAVLSVIMSFLFILYDQYTLLTLIAPMTLFMMGSGLAFPNAMGIYLDCFPEHTGATSSLVIGGLTAVGGLFTIVIAKLPVHLAHALPGFLGAIVILMIFALFLLNRSCKK